MKEKRGLLEESCSSKLDKMEERLGLLEQSCPSIALVISFKTATYSSVATIAHIFKSSKANN